MQDWVVLQFGGLDIYADVYINGEKIGTPTLLSSQDMFLPFEYDVSTDFLKSKGNEVVWSVVSDLTENQKVNIRVLV